MTTTAPSAAAVAMWSGNDDGTTTSQVYATVSGGRDNTASDDTPTVGGGDANTASGNTATVGGGSWNNASGDYATVGGGRKTPPAYAISQWAAARTNTASGELFYGGRWRLNDASGYSTVGGG